MRFQKSYIILEHVQKKGITCLDCGEFWQDSTKVKKSKCPHCGQVLDIQITRRKTLSQTKHMVILDVVGDYQVARTIRVQSHKRADGPAKFSAFEIYQHWFSEHEAPHIIARQRNSFNNDTFTGELEIRSQKIAYDYRNVTDKVYPKYKVQPKYVKLGFKGSLHWVSSYTFFTSLPNNNRAETLLKSKQPELFWSEMTRNTNGAHRFWNSIKIAIRNRYKVTDASMWYDYLELLDRYKKDLRSPKYVCPKNLKKEHDILVSKRRKEIDAMSRQRAREEAERKTNELRKKIDRIGEETLQYMEHKSVFFGLKFSRKNITIKVLEDVKEFLQEGDAHGHCVFVNEYYKKADSLILSAKINGKPVETVEVSLTSFQVVQSRGLNNLATEYNRDIVNLVNSNMNLIKQRFNQIAV